MLHALEGVSGENEIGARAEQGLGMQQELASDGGERIIVAQPILEGLDDVVEEDGLACMVCREGYSLRPTDLLAFTLTASG